MIAYQTVVREAEAECKPLNHHVAHLAVHGFLHLIGYDHQSTATAKAMERLEVAVLAGLGVPNPYLVRRTGRSRRTSGEPEREVRNRTASG